MPIPAGRPRRSRGHGQRDGGPDRTRGPGAGEPEEEQARHRHDEVDVASGRPAPVPGAAGLAGGHVGAPAGAVWNKEQFLAGLKSGEGKVLSFTLDDMKVRVYGDAAVVTGRMTAKQTFRGQDTSGQYQCTDVLIKKAGRWHCVATHLSAIARK